MGDHRARRNSIGAGAAAVAMLLVAALLIAGAVALEVLADPTQPAAAERVPMEPPARGMLHCPATAGEDETAVLAVAAAGDAPSQVTVLRYEGGTPARDETVEVPPGGEHVVTLEGEAAQQPVGAAWEGGPAVATWRTGDGAAAPCETGAVPVWHVTGFDTTAQNTATLHLFNPFAVDAVVRVTFGTPTGRVALVLTDNVLVPARSSIRMNLNEFEPEQPDLAVTVEVLTGRVVPQGELRMQPTANQPGPSGRTLLPATEDAELEWGVGYARWAEGDSSWLSLFNPGDREAAIEIRVSDPLPDGVALLREVSVPAGGVVRVDVDETSSAAEFGVAVASVNEVPVVVARVNHAQRGNAEDVAASVALVPGERWAVAGAAAAGRRGSLSLYNPGGAPVQVHVDAGAGTPDDWAALAVEPNARIALDLADAGPDRASIPLVVASDGPVVADLRVLTPGDPLGMWTAAAVPSTAWEGPGSRPPVRRDGTLATTSDRDGAGSG